MDDRMTRTREPTNLPKKSRAGQPATRGSRGKAYCGEATAGMVQRAKAFADSVKADEKAAQDAAIANATSRANAMLADLLDPAEVAALGRIRR